MRRVNSVLDVGVFRHTIRLTISLCNNVLGDLCHGSLQHIKLQFTVNYSKEVAELVNTGYKVNIEVKLIARLCSASFISLLRSFFFFFFLVLGCIVSISNVHLTDSRHNIFV